MIKDAGIAPQLKVTPLQLANLIAAEASHPEARQDPLSSPFLSLVTGADREPLIHAVDEVNREAGDIVFLEGDPGDNMYLILSGKVVIVKGDLDSPTILAYRGAGEIFGEMALLENQPRSATVIALSDLRLMGANSQQFEGLLHDMPSIGRGIMEMLSSRLRSASEARSTGVMSEKRLSQQVSALQSEKQRLEELQRLRQETSELIIHDLRNPLSAIAMSLKLLDIVLPPEVLQANQGILSIAQASCERMQRLVEALLEVSTMEAGEAHFDIVTVDLAYMIQEAVKHASILARRGVTLQAQLPERLPLVLADRDKVERVLVNLLDNALKYTPENGSICIAAKKKGTFVLVSVSDEGPGIPPDERQRIFERFAQIPGKRSQRRGFGLGLTYCRLAIERHGGRIWVEPGKGGQGSRFSFTLPIAKIGGRNRYE
jgi:signal transduction histidine kinase